MVWSVWRDTHHGAVNSPNRFRWSSSGDASSSVSALCNRLRKICVSFSSGIKNKTNFGFPRTDLCNGVQVLSLVCSRFKLHFQRFIVFYHHSFPSQLPSLSHLCFKMAMTTYNVLYLIDFGKFLLPVAAPDKFLRGSNCCKDRQDDPFMIKNKNNYNNKNQIPNLKSIYTSFTVVVHLSTTNS